MQKKGFNFINYDYLDKYKKSSSYISSGIDYMRVVIYDEILYFEDILKKLDEDNSNFYVDDTNLITYQKIRLFTGNSLIGSVVYDGFSFPVILYNPFERDIYKSYGKIDLYGSYFRLIEIGGLEPDFLENLVGGEIEIINKGIISRLDYKYDFFFENEKEILDINKLIKRRSNSKSMKYFINGDVFDNKIKKSTEFYSVGDRLQSWSYGSKQAKRVFTRCYNKLDDITSKGKYILYKDYFNFKNVYRLEFQLMNHFTKGFTYYNYSGLVDKIVDIMNFDYSNKLFYDYKNDVDFDILSHRIRYFKDFVGRGYKLHKAGFNPLTALVVGLQEKGLTQKDLVEISKQFKIENKFLFDDSIKNE